MQRMTSLYIRELKPRVIPFSLSKFRGCLDADVAGYSISALRGNIKPLGITNAEVLPDTSEAERIYHSAFQDILKIQSGPSVPPKAYGIRSRED